MDDNRLAKIAKNEKANTTRLSGFESWTSTSEKNRLNKMKKKKILVKIQDFKMHHW